MHQAVLLLFLLVPIVLARAVEEPLYRGAKENCNDKGGVCARKNKCKGKINSNFVCEKKKEHCCMEEINQCVSKEDNSVMWHKVAAAEKAILDVAKEIHDKFVTVHDRFLEEVLAMKDNQGKLMDQITDLNLEAIEFSEVNKEGGKAVASSTYNSATGPGGAFLTGFWSAKQEQGFPQSIWYEFPEALVVSKFSFKSRPYNVDNKGNSLHITDGPTKYSFFGSNGPDCSDETKYVVLFDDQSGTPFTDEIEPKIGYIINQNSFKCYGFKVFDTVGRKGVADKYLTIANIQLYTPKTTKC